MKKGSFTQKDKETSRAKNQFSSTSDVIEEENTDEFILKNK